MNRPMSLSTIFQFVFGCRHSNLSRAFTRWGRTYRVCCDCGSEFDYSLETMAFVRAARRPVILGHRVARQFTR